MPSKCKLNLPVPVDRDVKPVISEPVNRFTVKPVHDKSV